MVDDVKDSIKVKHNTIANNKKENAEMDKMIAEMNKKLDEVSFYLFVSH